MTETPNEPTQNSPHRHDRPTLPFWVYALPIISLAVTLALWYQTRRELATLSESHRQLSADLDAARGLSTINVAGAPAKGPADQALTLVEFSDYECPFCIRHFTMTMPEIEAKYIKTGRIRYVFRDFPIDQLHPGAIKGHEAARCAGEQGRFWEMHTRMFSPAGSHGPAQLEAEAAAAGVGMDPFRECMGSGRTTGEIRKSVQLAVELGANGTPAFFVGVRDPATEDVRIVTAVHGAQPFAAFEKAFAEAEKRVGR
jgi:protein-disulfide isomerase